MTAADDNMMGALFLVLAIAFTCVALTPRWRKQWGWGRTGQGGPISNIGWSAWILSFLTISAAEFGVLPSYTIFPTVLVIVVAGIIDSWLKKD